MLARKLNTRALSCTCQWCWDSKYSGLQERPHTPTKLWRGFRPTGEPAEGKACGERLAGMHVGPWAL